MLKLLGGIAIVYGFSLLAPNFIPDLVSGACIFGGMMLIALPTNRRAK